MKSLFIFAALVSSSAFATPIPNAVLQQIYARSHMHQAKVLNGSGDSNPNQPLPPPEELKPVRQATIKAQITKLTFTKGQDGSYSVSAEIVCNKVLMADVFDVRGKDNYLISGGSMVSCDSTVNNQKVTVSAGGMLMLNHYQYLDDQARDYKEHSVWLSVDDGNNNAGIANGTGFLYNYFGTAEMGATNMVGYLAPQVPDLKEFFSLSYQVIDTP